MNKWEKEVLQSQLKDEMEVIKELEKTYKQAQNDINSKIAELLGRKDADEIWVVHQRQYQEALKKQVSGILDTLHANEFNTISDYLTKSYNEGFLGTMYDIHKQGIPLIFPIDQESVTRAVINNTKLSNSLYTSLGHDVKTLKKQVNSEISRGLTSNYNYTQIARNIDNRTKIGLNKSIRIARTEAHRIKSQASYDAALKAKENGADILKQWDATLDKRTRWSHSKLDGQIRELEEEFEGGAMYPGDFGIPSEDINCRCVATTRARWALDKEELNTLKDRAKYFELDKTKDFNDFKVKYLGCVEELLEIDNFCDKYGITQSERGAILDYISSKSYSINEALRSGSKLTNEQKEFVNTLNSALDKCPKYDGDLLRSLDFFSQEDVEDFIKNYKFDHTVKYKEFISTTNGNLYNPNGQVQILIENSTNGRDISVFNSGEQEVLYKTGSKFIVEKIVDADGMYYIKLKEV